MARHTALSQAIVVSNARPQRAVIPIPRDLTMPSTDSRTLRGTYSVALGQAMNFVVDALAHPLPAQAVGEPIAENTLRQIIRETPAFLASALRDPTRLTLARCLGFIDNGPSLLRQDWHQELVVSLLFDAFETGVLKHSASVLLVSSRSVVSREHNLAISFGVGTKLEFSPESVSISCADQPVIVLKRGVTTEHLVSLLSGHGIESKTRSVPLKHGQNLFLFDNNPLAAEEAHPDKSGSLLDLGGKTTEHWCDGMNSGLDVIHTYLPEIMAEMSLLLGGLVPVGYDDQKHLSASYLEAMGLVYLTLHPNVMTLAEALVHEYQHNKLNLLLGLDAVLLNGEEARYSSPVRPDPRPLRGVLLAVHAFQPIALMYERMIENKAPQAPMGWMIQRLNSIAKTCHDGCDVLLPNAQTTALGRELLAESRALDQRLARYL